MRKHKNIIILNTVYGVDEMIELYNILGDKVNLLYIDAPFDERVMREYNRLRTDSINGTRKANLSITVEDVVERKIKKDRKKNKKGANQLPKLSYSPDGKTIKIDEIGEKFKKDYNIEYLKLVRNYIVNPKVTESIQDIICKLNLFFEYIKLQHDDNSQLLVVMHNGIMRIIKKYYMNEENNLDSENLRQFKLILKK